MSKTCSIKKTIPLFLTFIKLISRDRKKWLQPQWHFQMLFHHTSIDKKLNSFGYSMNFHFRSLNFSMSVDFNTVAILSGLYKSCLIEWQPWNFGPSLLAYFKWIAIYLISKIHRQLIEKSECVCTKSIKTITFNDLMLVQ